jgi:uncharacterized protein (TIGR04255 family)
MGSVVEGLMASPEELLHFSRPPLTEVVLSFQFEPITKFSFADVGRLQDHFGTQFHSVEYHNQHPPMTETFGAPNGGISQIQFQFPLQIGMSAGIPLIWLISEDGARVVQFQPDRLVGNWRKTDRDTEYPHYDAVKASFLNDLRQLQSFLDARNLGALNINQCEIAYVNQIPVAISYGDTMARTFSNWANVAPEAWGEVEDASFATRFVLKCEAAPIGRIYFQANPAFDKNGAATIQLVVVGRGAPHSPTVESAVEFLDLAHDRIVRAFVDLTTQDAQKDWDRTA